MTFHPTALASIFVLSLSGCIINVNGTSMEPLEHSQQVMQLDASGLNTMVANTGAGSLEIIGVDGLTNIILEADIYTYEEMGESASKMAQVALKWSILRGSRSSKLAPAT